MKSTIAVLPNATGGASWTADGNGTAVSIHEAPSSYFTFYASGTFGSGTVKLQISPDDTGSVWVDVTGASLTTAGYKICQGQGRRLRAVVSGSTGATISVKVAGLNTDVVVTNS